MLPSRNPGVMARTGLFTGRRSMRLASLSRVLLLVQASVVCSAYVARLPQ